MAILITELNEDVNYIVEKASEGSGEKNYFIEGIIMQGDIKNRNGRTYPSSVLHKETKRYNEMYVSKKRAYGELNHPCFWEHTEALTENGWKKIKDVLENEKVLSYNSETKNAEYKEVEKVNINRYKGEMLHFKNRTFDTKVTRYHEFLLEYRNGDIVKMTAGEIYEKWKTNDPKIRHYKIIKTSNGIAESKDSIEIAGYTFDKLDFSAFLGFYMAEGCTTIRKNRNDQYRIQIFQKCETPEEFEFIDNMLNNLHSNIRFSSYENKDNYWTWTSHDRNLGRYLHSLGACYTKYIPTELLNQFDKVSARNFIEWHVLGDGRGNLDDKFTRCDSFTVSKQLAEDISQLASVAGLNHRCFEFTPKNDVLIEGRLILAENKNTLYHIQYLSSNGIYIDNRHLKIEKETWDDYVYCLTVKDNHTFFARDNGYVFWTGNCGPTINLDRVSHLFTELKEDGSNVVGKAKILDTPMGKIVKNLIDEEACLGISSRGMGSLKKGKNGSMEVQEDFMLATAGDIVADPSAPNAFVRGIMENVEWVYDIAANSWVPTQNTFDQIEEEVKNTPTRKELEAKAERLFNKFLQSL